MVAQHTDLIRFITGIPIAEDGTIYSNEIEDLDVFNSEMYEPDFSVSALTLITLEHIKNTGIDQVNVPIDKDTITYKVLNSDMADRARHEYLLLRVVILESFSLLFNIDHFPENLRFVSLKDMRRIRNNINYLSDFMGTVPEYFHMIESLWDMNISLGYLEHQVDVIMDNKGVR